MPVLVFNSTSGFHTTWAAQWQRADPINRKTVAMGATGTHEQLRDVLVAAAKQAGKTAFNELILAVGHGGSTSLDSGTVDLAPANRMRLARGTIGHQNARGTAETFYDPFYDFVIVRPGMKPKSDKMQDQEWVQQRDKNNIKGALFRLNRDTIYRSIGKAIQDAHVDQVNLLTCNVGNATDFIKKIALDWNVKVRAYKRFVIFQLNVGGSGRARAFFEGDTPGTTGSNTVAAETELPQQDFVTVGPPPGTPRPTAPVTPVVPKPAPRKRGQKGAWLLHDGVLVHPDAPVGGGGPGHFRVATAFEENEGVSLPHPYAPAARHVDPTDLEDLA